MKKFNIVYVLAAMVFVLASCKDEVGPTLQDPTAPALTAPATGTSMVLTEANAKDAIAFSWSAASSYGFAAAITYKVQMSLPGENFEKPSAIVTTSDLTATLSNGDLNNLLMAAELTPGADSDIQFRIEASVSEFVPSVYSPAITLTVKPYRVIVNYPKLYCPGSYQGWAPDKAPVVSSLLSDGKYEGYLWFADAGVQFKFTDGPSWDKNWGDDGADGTLNAGGANIVSGEAGQYKVNVDIPKLTYTITRTAWGVIGSATAGGWDSDQNMTFDASAGVWNVTLDLVAGDLKFRANDDWAINMGDNKTNKSLEYDGANIPIAAAGNYTVTLDLRGPIYTYVITKN